MRLAGAAAGVLGECLSLVFSKEGDACGGCGEDEGEEWTVGGAGFCADLEALLVCATAGIGFMEGDEDGSMAVC